MTREQIQKLLDTGEEYTIEYKENVNKISDSVYETVCSFSNRYGGYILLGVEEVERNGRKVGSVIGVNKEKVYDMKRNFITTLNNQNKIKPAMYLKLEEFDYNGMTILWVYVPENSQLCFCDGKVFDRNDDADQDITLSPILLGDVVRRKSTEYFEKKILPFAQKSDLKLELMDKVRRLVVGRNTEHPWRDMDDMDIMRSAGLYERDVVTGQEGFNVAAVLLFGKTEVIQSVAPGYKTDAIYRVQNLDRYDDRLIVQDNLIEAYDKLMGFIEKHTDDRFTLDGDIRVSSRNYIAREVISNILIHREFSSAFPAKLIIEKDVLKTENWSKSKFHGRLELQTFSPYPKNPILANFFVNLGRADTLGSGMRNLYKYTKLYSGAEPVLTEGDIFRIEIPLHNVKSVLEGHDVQGVAQDVAQDDVQTVIVNDIISLIKQNVKITRAEIAEKLGMSTKTVERRLKDVKNVHYVGSGYSGHWEIESDDKE